MAKHANLLLLFILLITVGCYFVFSKEQPEQHAQSNLKKITRNLKATRSLHSDVIGDGYDSGYEHIDSGHGDSDGSSDSDSASGVAEETPLDPSTLLYNGIIDRIKQMCETTDCVDDRACNWGSASVPELNCSPCNVLTKKCTYGLSTTPETATTELESSRQDKTALPTETQDTNQTNEI